ncbi:MAG: carboxylesterase family protein [Pseudomonadales bacterium]
MADDRRMDAVLRRGRPRLLKTLSALTVAFLVLTGATLSARAEPTSVVLGPTTLQGVAQRGVHAFKGIPYAQPPTGERRWMAPLPVELERGNVDATRFGAICPQTRPEAAMREPMAEDCLTLNVWTPGPGKERRPVLVWIHGGGFRAGSGNLPGEVLASRGVVVVSLNYRLGPLGFFAHEALEGAPANFGLMDMVEALRWVHAHIGAFGGDPDNVTIFGVSAGGMAVSLLLATSAADGLYQRAIAQSGYGTWALPRSRTAPEPGPLSMTLGRADSAEALAHELVARVASGPQSRARLYALDAQMLVSALAGFQLPIVDGTTLPEEPGVVFARGDGNRVPIITGGNSYEGSVMPASGITLDAYAAMLGDSLEAAQSLYAGDFAVSRERGLSRIFGDNRYLLAARVLGNGADAVGGNVWLYYVDYPPDARTPGTPHGWDAGTLWRETFDDPIARAIAERLRGYWVNFATRGDPNGRGSLSGRASDTTTRAGWCWAPPTRPGPACCSLSWTSSKPGSGSAFSR